MKKPIIEIAGFGRYLPAQIVRNDDWPEEIVDSWRRGKWSPDRAAGALKDTDTVGARAVLRIMEELASDPFQGAVERRYMTADDSSVGMVVAAAREALDSAGIGPSDVQFLLGSSLVPDVLISPDVCWIHQQLGLPEGCFTVAADATCNSFQMQLALAEGLIASGRYERGLLVQCSAASRITPREQPLSIHFGDGATAVLVQRASGDRGLIEQRVRTDGSIHEAMVLQPANGLDWWNGGPLRSGPKNREQARKMLLTFPDIGRELVSDVLDAAAIDRDAIDFFAGHQATSWWRRAAQEVLGLTHARYHDTYPHTGTLSACNLPMLMYEAQENGSLSPGDLVVMYQGGTGATYAASLMRF